jgi:hypothetical protein
VGDLRVCLLIFASVIFSGLYGTYYHLIDSFLAEFDRARRTATVSSSFCMAFSLSKLTSLARFPVTKRRDFCFLDSHVTQIE